MMRTTFGCLMLARMRALRANFCASIGSFMTSGCGTLTTTGTGDRNGRMRSDLKCHRDHFSEDQQTP